MLIYLSKKIKNAISIDCMLMRNNVETQRITSDNNLAYSILV